MREPHRAVTPARDSSNSKQTLRTSAVREIERRLFLKQGLSLGALTLLTGCDALIPARYRACSTDSRDGMTARKPRSSIRGG